MYHNVLRVIGSISAHLDDCTVSWLPGRSVIHVSRMYLRCILDAHKPQRIFDMYCESLHVHAHVSRVTIGSLNLGGISPCLVGPLHMRIVSSLHVSTICIKRLHSQDYMYRESLGTLHLVGISLVSQLALMNCYTCDTMYVYSSFFYVYSLYICMYRGMYHVW